MTEKDVIKLCFLSTQEINRKMLFLSYNDGSYSGNKSIRKVENETEQNKNVYVLNELQFNFFFL